MTTPPPGELSISAFGPLSTRIAEALATVRREAIKDAVKLVQTMSLIEARHCSIEFINGAQWAIDRAARSIVAALEASATEKGEVNNGS